MRNAEFNREQVLRAAMCAFLQKGYNKTSMQDLTKATGLHPGFIYCAFENKRGLLLAALTQYKQDRANEFEQFFVGQHSMLTALKAYLDDIVSQCGSCDASQSCLLTKALSEVAEQDEEIRDVISDNLKDWHLALAEKFAQAKAAGELATTRSDDHLARYLMMGIYGLRTFAYTHPETKQLQQLSEQLFHDVRAD